MDLDPSQIEEIFDGIEGSLNAFHPLSGGAINATFKVIWNQTPYILRFYLRDPLLAEVEQDVYQLIDGEVPVPNLLKTGKSRSFPYALFTFVDKERIDGILEPSLSYDLGEVLAKIHSYRFPEAGLFGPRFAIHTPFEEGSSPYFDYTRETLTESSLAWKRLEESRAIQLREFLRKQYDYFPKIQQGGVLVHSDFKPVNLLWNKQEGLTVLDWEFAHSGDPLMDFAILLRHFREFPLKVEQLEKGYGEHGGALPDDWIQRARITDVVNVVDLLNRPKERPEFFDSLIKSIDFTLSKWESLDQEIRSACR